MDERTLDRDAERLFAMNGGALSDDNPGLIALTRFVDDLREAYVHAPDPATRVAHVQAVVEAYREALVHNGHSNNGHKNGFKPAATARHRPRRIFVRGAIAAGAVVLAGGSAMAATGSLPDGVQDAVSRVAESVGLSIPHSDKAVVVPNDIDPGEPATTQVRRETKKTKKAAESRVTDVDRDRSSDDDDDDDASSSVSRRPRNDGPDKPAAPIAPDASDDDDSSSDSGGIGGDRGDPSGGDDPGGDPGDDDQVDPGDDDDGAGGRGDPIDGSPGDDEPDDDAADEAEDAADEAGGAGEDGP